MWITREQSTTPRTLPTGYSYTYNVYVNNTTFTINLANVNDWDNGGNTDINTTN